MPVRGVLGMAKGARLAAACLLLTAPAVRAQEEIQAVLSGQLLISGVPADSGTVFLHRITPEEAQGQVDSTSVLTGGFFSFRLPNLPVPEIDTLLATTEYEGVLYWGVPISAPAQLDSLYVINAFVTETAPEGGVQFPLMIQQISVEEGPRGWLVTHAFVLRNDSNSTFVPSDSGAVWQYPLPTGALGARLVDVGPAAGPVRFSGGRTIGANAIVPGPNFYMIEYDMESLDMAFEMRGDVEIARILVREPAPSIQVEGMAPAEPWAVEGGSYLQWVAEGLRDQVIRVRPGEEAESRSVVWMSLALGLLLVGAGAWGVRRKGAQWATHGPDVTGAAGAWPGSHGRRLRKDILLDIARLDEAFAGADPAGQARSEYVRRRADLLRELSE